MSKGDQADDSSTDDSSVGGYHNEGGEDQLLDNAFCNTSKKNANKMTADSSDTGSIMFAFSLREVSTFTYSTTMKVQWLLEWHNSCFV